MSNTFSATYCFRPVAKATRGQARNQGGIWGKALHSNFDICRNFQRIKMKFYIVIIFKKPYWNFSLFCWLIISLQDLP